MKLVESAKVASTPINNADLGINQIELVEEKDETEYKAGVNDKTLGDFLNATTKPGKNREEKTYGDATITAYVAEGVCDNLASLQGKLVDVIFGKDNEVVYINVVDDAATGLFVTAWNTSKMEIELDGTTYTVADDATVSLFGSYAITKKDVWSAKQAIDAVMKELDVKQASKTVERTISASIVLDAEDDEIITSIDFLASEDFSGAVDAYKTNGTKVQLGMEQAVVKSINSKTGAIKTIETGKKISGKTLEKLEKDDVRVIKNNEIVTVEDIAVGDLLTTVIEDGAIKTIFISDNKVTGTLERIKNEVLTIDGEEYNAICKIYGNTDGDIEEIDEVKALAAEYLDEEVEVYLNFMGEVAVILSETESVPATIGIVKDIYGTELDKRAKVRYLELDVLSADGTKDTYYIYHEDEDENMKYDEDKPENNTIKDLAVGSVIWFSADAEGVIVYDKDAKDTEILVIADASLKIVNDKVTVDGKDLVATTLLNGSTDKIDDDDQEINGYLFDDEETVYLNNATDKVEVIKGWTSLVKNDEKHAITSKAIILVEEDDDEVLYFVDAVTAYESSKEDYAIVASIEDKKVDGELGTYVTLVGSDVEYELDSKSDAKAEVGDFVQYTVKDDEITLTEVVDVFTLSEVELEKSVKPALNSSIIKAEGNKAVYEVEEVKDRKVYYVEIDGKEEPKLSLVKTEVTVFDVENGTVEVVDVDELDDVIAGKYAFGITADEDNETKIDTIIVFEFDEE